MKIKSTFILLIIIGLNLNAQNWKTPTIEGYGKIADYENVAIKPDPKQDYKVFFNITEAKEREGVNESLWKIARLINLLENAGVPKDNIDIACVISGPATNITLSEDSYFKKQSKTNPNLDLMEKLTNYGVEIHLCGQAAAKHKIDPAKDLNSFTKLTLSALTDIPFYQMNGYTIMY